MELEVRFTVKGKNIEYPFTVVDLGEDGLFLYSNYENEELKYKLENKDGNLLLSNENKHPFEEDESIIEERLVGLSSAWLEAKSQGFENEFDFDSGNLSKPGYGPDDIFVENKPFSLRQIVELINYGDIDLSPNFQRNFIWDKTRQSKLIESILLGLPLPSIYLSQYEDGRLTIVDGLQRLTTIKRFLEDELVLSNLEYLENCNDKKYSELESVLSPLRLRRFGQTQIMCFVIDYRSPSKLKYDLFRRLNTGGKPLNNQEIRNCLSKPDLQNTLHRMISSDAFKNATSESVKDTRMEAQEAALRFIYFYNEYNEENPIGGYNGYMDDTLDDFVDYLNYQNDINKYIPIYENALKCSYYLFQEYAFRKVFPDRIGERRTPINKLLMLSISVLLSKCNYDSIEAKHERGCLIRPLADIILNNNEFFNAITWSTNSKWNINTAFTILKKELFDIYLI